MAVGDWWSVSRGIHRHHFIELREGYVIHRYSETTKRFACIRIDPEFVATRGRSKRLHTRGGLAAAERALKRVGERGYNLLTKNCEHFCSECINGEPRCDQVKFATAGTGAGLVYAALPLPLEALQAAGVPGLSAVGVTTGLTSIGAAVGGGIAAGAALAVALPLVAALGIGFLAILACNERGLWIVRAAPGRYTILAGSD